MILKHAKIQQKKFVVLESKIEINNTEEKKTTNILPFDLNFEILIPSGDSRTIRVILEITVNSERSYDEFVIYTRTGAEYHFTEELSKESKEYHALLSGSALPCLINQTRLYLKTMTSYFPIGEYILPMIDMRDLLKQKSREQIIEQESQTEYRKRKNSNTWHWRQNCSKYPKTNYTTISSKPSSGKLCKECEAKSDK
jgi:hypothetical protein